MKKEYPLVLLHVTLLPIPLHYSQEILESVLPPSILENWTRLRERATDTVLQRGILIPHPKEDYDLLESRLLESLELKVPRILKCGHFHLEPEEEADVVADDSNHEDEDDDNANDLDICIDCGRRIRDGKFGSAGSGSKRWDIRLYAANGLMRAGAWSAAWREMERVDVEIVPWMEEDMKRELELRKEEEARQMAEEERVRAEEGVGVLDDERLREIYGGEARAFVDGVAGETEATEEMARREMGRKRREGKGEVPLWNLFCEYIRHAARDRRNIAIFVLSALVVLLSMGVIGGGKGDGVALSSQDSSSSVHETSTATVHNTPVEPSSSSIEFAPVASSSLGSAAPSPTAEPPQDKEEEEGEEEAAISPLWTEANEDEVSELIED